MNKHDKSSGLLAVCIVALLAVAARADDLMSNEAADEAPDYDLEEMVIIAKEPDWRKPKDEQDWRPDRFKLPEDGPEKKMEWFPEYSKDERDDYNQVRDRMNEEPEFQLFKWKF